MPVEQLLPRSVTEGPAFSVAPTMPVKSTVASMRSATVAVRTQ